MRIRRCRSRPSSARSRTRSRASAACARDAAAADRRTRLGLSLSRTAVGTPRRQEGRRARRLSRAQVELRRRHDANATSCRAKLSALLPRLRELIGRTVDPRSPAADRGGDRRARRRARVRARAAHPRAAHAGRSRAARRASRPSTACEFWTQTGGPATVGAALPRVDAARLRAARVRHHDAVRSRPSSRRSTTRSTGCWCAARWRCSIRSPASASATSSAASATSRCRSPVAAPTSIGVEGSAALVRARARTTRRSTAWPDARDSCAPTSSSPTRSAGAARAPRPRAHRSAARRRDRAREGAARQGRADGLKRIVYVSCAPRHARARRVGAGARARLRLAAAGVVNMFPHTAHVESIALFEWRAKRKKKGAAGALFVDRCWSAQSRLPEKAIRMFSRLTKML